MSDSGDPSETSTWRIPKPGRGMYIPFATVGLIASALTGGWQVYERWEAHKAAEIQAAVKHAQEEKALQDRLDKLERWKCVLGWAPPRTTNPERKCDTDVGPHSHEEER